MYKVYNVICSLENIEQGHKATYEYQVCAEDDKEAEVLSKGYISRLNLGMCIGHNFKIDEVKT